MDELFNLLREVPAFVKIIFAVMLGGIIYKILKKVVKTIILLLIIITVYILLEKYIFI